MINYSDLDFRNFGLKRCAKEDVSDLTAFSLGRMILSVGNCGGYVRIFVNIDPANVGIPYGELPKNEKLDKYYEATHINDINKEDLLELFDACREYDALCAELERDRIPTYEQVLERLTFVKTQAIKELSIATNFIKSEEFLNSFITMHSRTLTFFQRLYKELLETSKIEVEETAKQLANNSRGAVYMNSTEYLLTNNSRTYDALIRDIISKK